MSGPPTAELRGMAFRETYQLALQVLLPPECELRFELAAVMAWSAMTGANIKAMAAGMKRSWRWTRDRLAESRQLVGMLRDSDLDDYLSQ